VRVRSCTERERARDAVSSGRRRRRRIRSREEGQAAWLASGVMRRDESRPRHRADRGLRAERAQARAVASKSEASRASADADELMRGDSDGARARDQTRVSSALSRRARASHEPEHQGRGQACSHAAAHGPTRPTRRRGTMEGPSGLNDAGQGEGGMGGAQAGLRALLCRLSKASSPFRCPPTWQAGRSRLAGEDRSSSLFSLSSFFFLASSFLLTWVCPTVAKVSTPHWEAQVSPFDSPVSLVSPTKSLSDPSPQGHATSNHPHRFASFLLVHSESLLPATAPWQSPGATRGCCGRRNALPPAH